MILWKRRSSSDKLLGTIPEALKKAGNLFLTPNPTECSKVLGIYWNTVENTLHVATPELKEEGAPTKRQVAFAVARTFGVLGWFAPTTVTLKILYRNSGRESLAGMRPFQQSWKESDQHGRKSCHY